jgi:hypothetical protein
VDKRAEDNQTKESPKSAFLVKKVPDVRLPFVQSFAHTKKTLYIKTNAPPMCVHILKILKTVWMVKYEVF